MPTATVPTVSEDQIEDLVYDLLYLSRTGETPELRATIDLLAENLCCMPSTIINSAVDPASGNGLLHMASANGHTDTVKELLSLTSPYSTIPSNLQNTSGNTPLHWAALNGHLDAVKMLVEAGADVTVINGAGHDAIYAAEVNEKTEVAEWLLESGKGLETGVAGSKEEEAETVGSGSAEIGERQDESEDRIQDE